MCLSLLNSIYFSDVDAAFKSRELESTSHKLPTDEEKLPPASGSTATAFDGMNRLTFSGLLNALDGVASAEGRILFMTTNYVERLDKALIRPGRVDFRQYVGYATKHQLERMFRRFYRNASDEEVQRFVSKVFEMSETPEISLAQLQGLFLRYKSDPAAIFNGLSMLFDKD